jgi:hypothetical protein
MKSTEIKRLFNASKPSRSLNVSNPDDQKYYIDFSSVRGGEILEHLKRTIDLSDENTCQLFTGHRGSGKSTELLRLKTELEQQGFHVVYFESDKALDMTDIDISDILLVIAGYISESLKSINLSLEPGHFAELFDDIKKFFPLDLKSVELSAGIAKITAQSKESPKLRAQIREALESRTRTVLDSINQDILVKAQRKLFQQNKKGLVVIVDNLEKIAPRTHPSKPDRLNYLFVERGAQLRGLHCHMIYTIPLELIFSPQRETMVDQLGGGIAAKILPMVPIKKRNGEYFSTGLTLLRRMVMARAFPDEELDSQLSSKRIKEVFYQAETLERLCQISGGRVRNLLSFIYRCLQIEDPPISRDILEQAIAERRDQYRLSIDANEWSLLRHVAQQKPSFMGQPAYQALFGSSLVFEYRDENGCWFDVNPIVLEAPEMK